MKCSQCIKDALYRNKQGELFCYNHYWSQSEYSKPNGDKFSDSDVYRSCPYCGEGDLCDTNNCASKCLQCGIIDENRGETYCSNNCANLAQKNNTVYTNHPNQSNFKKPSKAEIRKRKENLKKDWACPHYEAEKDNDLIEACQQNNHEQALDYYLPQWKPVMKNKDNKNICADCYHDSAEYFLLVQKLTTDYINKKIIPANYHLTSTSQNDYERMKSGTLTDLDEWKQVKKKLIKEISDYKSNELGDSNRERAERTNDNEFLSKDQREQKQSSINQLQSQITNLENKPNKTEEEQKELTEKKKELERLNNNNQNNQQESNKNQWIKPVLIIGSLVLVSGLVIYLISKNKKVNH